MKSKCVYVYSKVFAFHLTFLRLLYLETPLTRFFACKKLFPRNLNLQFEGMFFLSVLTLPSHPTAHFFLRFQILKNNNFVHTHSVIRQDTRRENKTEEAPESLGGQTVR